MNIVHPTSLAGTIELATDALFYEKTIPAMLCSDVTTLLLSRQILSGTNSGFFIPFTAESHASSRLYTGEVLHTEFARRHIQLIEAARLLKLIALDGFPIDRSITLADLRMKSMCYSRFCSKGECKSITIAYMRYLAISKAVEDKCSLSLLLNQLANHRDGKGRWSGFPFYYTLMMLTEVDDSLGSLEIQYAASFFENQPATTIPADPYFKRRQEIITKAFGRS